MSIGFRESIFVYSAAWLREFGELYRREIGLPYYCHLRADMMTEEMVELLAWSGCHTVNVGIETANEHLANDVLRRQIKMDRLKQASACSKRAGIVVFADNILGIPGGTLRGRLRDPAAEHRSRRRLRSRDALHAVPWHRNREVRRRKRLLRGGLRSHRRQLLHESVIKFPSEDKKRQTENLHKLFAVTAASRALAARSAARRAARRTTSSTRCSAPGTSSAT